MIETYALQANLCLRENLSNQMLKSKSIGKRRWLEALDR